MSCKKRVGLSELATKVKDLIESDMKSMIIQNVLNDNKECIFEEINNLVKDNIDVYESM